MFSLDRCTQYSTFRVALFSAVSQAGFGFLSRPGCPGVAKDLNQLEDFHPIEGANWIW